MGAESLVQKTLNKAKAKGAATPSAKLVAKAKTPAKPPPPPKVKVKLAKPVIDMIKWMNDSGELGTELRLGAVAVQLAAISQDDALEVLEACFDFPSGRKEPIGFVKEAAKELAAQAEAAKAVQAQCVEMAQEETMRQDLNEASVENWAEMGPEKALVVGKCPEFPEQLEDKVIELCGRGLLQNDTFSDRLGSFLAFLGEQPALDVLSDLSNAMVDTNTKQFILSAANPILVAERGSAFAMRISQRIRWMNCKLGFGSPLDLSAAAYELAWLGEPAALQVLKRMTMAAATGHVFADPTDWICGESRALCGEERPSRLEKKREGGEETKGEKAEDNMEDKAKEKADEKADEKVEEKTEDKTEAMNGVEASETDEKAEATDRLEASGPATPKTPEELKPVIR